MDNDVDQLIEALRAAKRAFPQQRLGQLIANMALYPGSTAEDVFNIEDSALLQRRAACIEAGRVLPRR